MLHEVLPMHIENKQGNEYKFLHWEMYKIYYNIQTYKKKRVYRNKEEKLNRNEENLNENIT